MTEERREAETDPDEPRQRRDAPWPEGVPRNRRRVQWGEFRGAYPRIVTAMALGIVALLLADGLLLVKRRAFARELGALRGSMGRLERERTDGLLTGQEGRVALLAAVQRQQATREGRLNLAVSAEDGKMYLLREGARLREMRVTLGAAADMGSPPTTLRIVPPIGRRSIVRVVDATHRWEVPGWLSASRGAAEKAVTGGLGPIAFLLDDGNVIYSRPQSGPLSGADYVLPGSVRASAEDLAAVAENVHPGFPVYFY